MARIASLRDIEALEAVPLEERHLPRSTYEWLRRGAAGGDALALRFVPDAGRPERSIDYDYAAFLGDVHRAANAFHGLGVRSDDVVSLLLPNIPEAFTAFFGAEAVGIANPVNPLLERDTLVEILNAAGTKVLVTTVPLPSTDLWAKVEAVRPRVPTLETVLRVDLRPYLGGLQKMAVGAYGWWRGRPDVVAGQNVLDYDTTVAAASPARLEFDRSIRPEEIASYFHTGGTTGSPKLAMHTHGNEVFDAWALAEVVDAEASLVTFCGLPLFHVNGITTTGLVPFGCGATVVLGPPQGYRAPGLFENFWRLVEHYRLQSFSAVPTVYSRLLDVPVADHDVSSLEYAACGAAPMPPELFRRFETTTGLRILEGYGLTEGTCVSAVNPRFGESRIGSVGLRLPYQETRTVLLGTDGSWQRDCAPDESGALVLRGPNVIPGYREPGHDAGLWVDRGDGGGPWLNTGDLARIDSDGYIWLTGRSKELIIRGGHNIDPALVEGPLAEHPDVALAAAIGRPDSLVGEVPVAYVQLRPGARAGEAELLDHSRRHVGERAAVPKAVRIVDELPLTAVGKVYKPALRHAEIEAIVRQVIRGIDGVIDADVRVRTDAQRGDVATVRLRLGRDTDPAVAQAAVAAALGRYAFQVELEI